MTQSVVRETFASSTAAGVWLNCHFYHRQKHLHLWLCIRRSKVHFASNVKNVKCYCSSRKNVKVHSFFLRFLFFSFSLCRCHVTFRRNLKKSKCNKWLWEWLAMAGRTTLQRRFKGSLFFPQYILSCGVSSHCYRCSSKHKKNGKRRKKEKESHSVATKDVSVKYFFFP